MVTEIASLQDLNKVIRQRVRSQTETWNAYSALLESDDNISSFIDNEALSKKGFVDVIALRRLDGSSKSSGGGNQAASNQTDQLYANTPLKFVEEFLQNADDCRYEEPPEININIDEAHSTVEFVYNECGFSRKDVWALTEFEGSTKSDDEDKLLSVREEGVFYKEKTGRKGMGFKSVFTLPADNVIVHICSNGFSFKLDGNISHIVPIWEENDTHDGLTHITVELVNPADSLNQIYPHFKQLFGAEKLGNVFQTSPLLFMHRIHKLHVSRVDSKEKEFFEAEIGISGDYRYEEPFRPTGPILSGIKHNDSYYCKASGEFVLKYSGNAEARQDIVCFRKSYMVNVDGKWRVISFIAPIMENDASHLFRNGALFRTFPLFDEKFNLPVAVDAPYELCTDRKDLDFTDTKGHCRFNNELSQAIFGFQREKSCLLEDFYLSLRECPGIRMDYYLPTASAKIYDTTRNRNQSGGFVIASVDLRPILVTLPLLRTFDDESVFISLEKAYVLDKKIYSWPQYEILQKQCPLEVGQYFVAEQYKGSSVIRKYAIFKKNFLGLLSAYLDSIEDIFGIGSNVFLSYVSNQLYPYLLQNRKEIYDQKLWPKLPIYISHLKTDDGERLVREAKGNSLWRTSKQKNILSFGKFRIIDSSPVDFKSIGQCVKSAGFQIGRLDLDFEPLKIEKLSNKYQCNNLDDALNLIKAGAYYGFSLNGLKIEQLNGFSVSETYDERYNPFREAKIVQVIPDEEVKKLAAYFGDSIPEAVKVLEMAGLRTGERLISIHDSSAVLELDTLKALERLPDSAAKKLVGRLFEAAEESKCTLLISYGDIKNASIRVKNWFLCKSKWLSPETRRNVSKDVLRDEKVLATDSEEGVELLARAWSAVDNTRQFEVKEKRISVEYCIKRDLLTTIRDKVIKKGAKWLQIVTTGSFEEIPASDLLMSVDILNSHLEGDKRQKYGSAHFYFGKLSDSRESLTYLEDGRKQHIFLNTDQDGQYFSALREYIGAKKDDEANRINQDISESNKEVRLQYIVPAFGDSEITFDDIKETFADDKEAFIKVLSYFRSASYKEISGNTGRTIEKEVIDDYKDNPWKFVYDYIQNVDDCTFPGAVKPDLAIEMNQNTGSITFSYNETGFTADDINALTSYNKSTKTSSNGNRLDKSILQEGIFNRIRTGKLGRGFKSVFALPGDDIEVHIQSNGFSFYFHKRIGIIVPIWENVPNPHVGGTRITVKGLKKDTLASAFDQLVQILSLNTPEKLFSQCPVLYLRKIQSLSLSNGNTNYSVLVDVDTPKYSAEVYSIDFKKTEVLSGIKNGVNFCKDAVRTGTIHYSVNQEQFEIPVFQYAMMAQIDSETRLLRATVPLLYDRHPGWQGGFYSILPLSNISYEIPVAIDAPFEVNSGRSTVKQDSKINQRVLELIETQLLPNTYNHLKSVDDICISQYIPKRNQTIPDLQPYGFNITSCIRKLPILKLQSGKGYVPCDSAQKLTKEMYGWPYPEKLATLMNPSHADVLVEEQYCEVSAICSGNLLSVEFVPVINAYLDFLEENGVDLWPVLNETILPYICEHYKELSEAYYQKHEVQKLRELKVFGFTDITGTAFRVDACDSEIWVIHADAKYRSYGEYRILDSAPVQYSEAVLKLLKKLGKNVLEYKQAFTTERFSHKNIKNWEDAKRLLQTLLYYHIQKAPALPFLQKCLIDEKYCVTDNLFLTAYLTTRNVSLARHYITAADVTDIAQSMKLSDVTEDDVVKLILGCGIRKTQDAFTNGPDTVKFSNEGISLLNIYCTNKKNAEDAISCLANTLEELLSSGKKLLLKYDDLKNCSTYVFAALFESAKFKKYAVDMKDLAVAYLNNSGSETTGIYAETILAALPLADKLEREHTISISLDTIIENHLGGIVQKGMLAAKAKHPHFSLRIIAGNDVITPFESDDVNRALEWLDDAENVKKFTYYLADIQDAFDKQDIQYLFDDQCVYLSHNHSESAQYDFIKQYYTSQGDTGIFRAMTEIAHEQKILKGSWTGTKTEYIKRLNRFRTTTDKVKGILYPNLQEATNNATGNPIEYIIPELLQNVNDCRPASNEEIRTLVIRIANPEGTMSLEYEEAGFDFADVYSITALGQSSKHDEREGEKGLGFKKVFELFNRVEIHSNRFDFALETSAKGRDSLTIPKVISNSVPYGAAGKTVMIFHTGNREGLRYLAKQWEKLFVSPYADSIVSPLFLENISAYKLIIDGTEKSSLTREDIESKYYIQTYPLLETYRGLASNAGNLKQFKNCEGQILNKLRSRKKCRFMSDSDFRNYVNGLRVTICFPKQARNVCGRFYSTLPVTKETHAAMFINLPMELSTGRNEIMEYSDYNRQIFKLTFGMEHSDQSIVNFALENFAKEHDEVDAFLYLMKGKQDFADYLDLVGRWSESGTTRQKNSIGNLKVFHTHNSRHLATLKQSYSVDAVLYQYMHSGAQINNDLEQWLIQHDGELKNYRLLDFRSNYTRNCQLLEDLFRETGLTGQRFPLRCDDEEDVALDYFSDEYGSSGKE